jgi:hypothetical protein
MSETTTIRAIHAALEATQRAAFEGRVERPVVTFGVYEPLGGLDAPTELLTPALLTEVYSIEQDDSERRQSTRDRIAARLGISVHCILSLQSPSLQIALRELAMDVAVLVREREGDLSHSDRGNRWGLGPAARRPERVELAPGDFAPGLNGRDAWVCSWEQVFYLPNTLSGD